jgi:hypothetical protein
MKSLACILSALFILSLATGCGGSNTTATPNPTNTLYPTDTPVPSTYTRAQTATPTETPEPTDTPTTTPTGTPIPTATPRRKLTAAEVGLPIGPEVESFVYKLCYVNTTTRFHAGDGVYYELGTSPAEYTVYAPIDGTVRETLRINDVVGWEIRVETPFVYEGQTVWYDLVHHDGPLPGITVGTYVERGEPIAKLFTARCAPGRCEKLVDYAIRNGPRGPNPQVDPFYPDSYLNVFLFVEDDLASRSVTYETCQGNPIP